MTHCLYMLINFLLRVPNNPLVLGGVRFQKRLSIHVSRSTSLLKQGPFSFSFSRQAYGNALLKLAEAHPRVVALDADMKNSTFSQLVRKKFPERHVECFICEQNMAGVSERSII